MLSSCKELILFKFSINFGITSFVIFWHLISQHKFSSSFKLFTSKNSDSSSEEKWALYFHHLDLKLLRHLSPHTWGKEVKIQHNISQYSSNLRERPSKELSPFKFLLKLDSPLSSTPWHLSFWEIYPFLWYPSKFSSRFFKDWNLCKQPPKSDNPWLVIPSHLEPNQNLQSSPLLTVQSLNWHLAMTQASPSLNSSTQDLHQISLYN